MQLKPNPSGQHAWQFIRRGGIFQVQLNTVEDLRALGTLDPKLWVALIDDYFARCQLAAFDQRAEAPLNPNTSLYAAIADTR